MDFYSLLLSKMAKEEIEKRVAEKIGEFHGLLTKEVALKVIAKELELYKEEEQEVKIKDIKPGMRKINVVGRIIAINKETAYPSGKRARAIVIQDGTGHLSLTLWNEDIGIINKLKVGDEVLVKSAYEKLGSLSLGYKGTLEITKQAPYTPLAEIADGGQLNVRGIIVSVGEKKEYEKNGRKYSYFTFIIGDDTGERKCVVWGTHNSPNIIPQNEVIMHNAFSKAGEIHINERSRLLAKKAVNVLSGRINELEVKDGMLFADINGRKIRLNRENALRFLDADAKDDVKLDTIVELKKQYLINKNVYVDCKEENGELVIK